MSDYVSIDEFLSNRSAYVKSGDVLVKATVQTPSLESEVKRLRPASSWDRDKRTIRFVMSSEQEDRDRDIILQAGLALDEFTKNPQAFYNHNARGFPVGGWTDLEKVLTGRPKRTEGTLQVLPEGVEPDADRLARHFDAGSIRTASIGFIPKRVKRREKPAEAKDEYGYYGYLIEEAEMVECSAVSIPSNPAALAKMAADGDVIAKELLELVLDTWAKDPATGLIVPRADFEEAFKRSTGNRTVVVIQHEDELDVNDVADAIGAKMVARFKTSREAIRKAASGGQGTESVNEPLKPETPPEQQGGGNEPTPPTPDNADNPSGGAAADPAQDKPLTEEQKDGLIAGILKWFGWKSHADIQREIREREEKAAADRETLRKEVQALTAHLTAKGLVD